MTLTPFFIFIMSDIITLLCRNLDKIPLFQEDSPFTLFLILTLNLLIVIPFSLPYNKHMSLPKIIRSFRSQLFYQGFVK